MSSPAPPRAWPREGVGKRPSLSCSAEASEHDPDVDVSFRIPDGLARICILICASWQNRGFRREVECEEGARSRF